MHSRGFIHQCTDFQALDDHLSQETVVAYLGFDATAKSLHVGSLLQIMILRLLQKAGHKPIVLIGGGTTKVGDPTGKDESRQLLSSDAIQENINGLVQVFNKFIVFDEVSHPRNHALLINNADWLDQLNYLTFLRDYGKLFTVNRMLSMESVKQRLLREQPLTFLEFNYILLQSFDFVELNKRHRTTLQLGGSDQWGNIVSGVELGRKLSLGPLFGLTAPLITTSDGRKMGKTAAGAIWLNKNMLSEYDYWQFWRNTADADVIRFLKLFTEIPLEEISEYERLEGADLNKVKVVLADEATKLLHGEECLKQIHDTTANIFGRIGGDELESLPLIQLDEFTSNIALVEVLVKAAMVTSRNEGRRLIKAGGVKLNDIKVDDEHITLQNSMADSRGRIKVSFGKKKHAVVQLPHK